MTNTIPAEPAQFTTELDDREYCENLIEEIVERCPQRGPASSSERTAQGILARELALRGGQVAYLPFRFNVSLYAVLALHFGLAACATAIVQISPLTALILHLLVATSYTLDSARRGYLLRRLFPFRQSQNLAVTFPARAATRLRILLVAHADAAFTGLQFHPQLISAGAEKTQMFPWRWTRRPLLIATFGLLWLAAWDVYVLVAGEFWTRLWLTYGAWGGFFLLIFLLNLEVAWRRKIVAGANDNLTACAALPLLAQRLYPELPEHVELVCVATGSEEAGNGGAFYLAQQMQPYWSTQDTIVVGLDSLANGRLRILRDGEILPIAYSRWLNELALNVAAQDPRFEGLTVFKMPAGGTDVIPFANRGYDQLCLGCIDDDLGTPRYYHTMDDTPENLDYCQLLNSIDYTEQLVRALVRARSHQDSRTESQEPEAAEYAV